MSKSQKWLDNGKKIDKDNLWNFALIPIKAGGRQHNSPELASLNISPLPKVPDGKVKSSHFLATTLDPQHFLTLSTFSRAAPVLNCYRLDYIMNHNSGFIIGIAHVFCKTLIEHTPKSHLKKHFSA